MADYKGKAVVLFFGFTQCPDVCPTTLTEMEEALKLLGPKADKVQVIFVTVDPERDTASVLAQYVPAFNPRFVGLRPADEAGLEKVTKDFRIYYKKVPGSKPGTYTIDHTAGSYVFDQNGQLRLYIKHAQGPEVLAHDLKNILQ
jgi:protein SCO1/2